MSGHPKFDAFLARKLEDPEFAAAFVKAQETHKHRWMNSDVGPWCFECDVAWPCPPALNLGLTA